MFDSAAAPESRGRVPVAFGGAPPGNAVRDGRGGDPCGTRRRVLQRGHGRVSGRRRSAILLPGNEYAPAGGTSGNRVGDGAGPSAAANRNCRRGPPPVPTGRYSVARRL